MKPAVFFAKLLGIASFIVFINIFDKRYILAEQDETTIEKALNLHNLQSVEDLINTIMKDILNGSSRLKTILEN